MGGLKNSELLKDELVQDEIRRHCWIESEKAGYDIGCDKAAADWLNRFSDAWIKLNPKKGKTVKRTARRI